MEEQILLKVPPTLARYIHTLLQTDSIDQQQIDLTFLGTGEKKRNVQLNIANAATANTEVQQQYLGVLTDLPTHIETYKTFDGGNYYKAADVSQMIVIPEVQSSAKKSADGEADSKNANDNVSNVKLPPVTYHSGITPPTQQIYPRRYNRIAKPPRDSVEAVEERLKNIQTGTYVEKYEIVEEVVEVPLEPGEELPDDELNRPAAPAVAEDGFARPVAPVTAAASKAPATRQPPAAAAANEWEDDADDTASETTNDETMSTGLRSTVSSDAGRTPLQSNTPAVRMGAQTPTLHEDNLNTTSATPRSTLRRQAMSTPTLPSPNLFADPSMASPTMQYNTDTDNFTRNAALAQSPSTMRSIDDFQAMDSSGMDLDAEIGGMLQLHAHTGTTNNSNDYFDSPTQQSRQL